MALVFTPSPPLILPHCLQSVVLVFNTPFVSLSRLFRCCSLFILSLPAQDLLSIRLRSVGASDNEVAAAA